MIGGDWWLAVGGWWGLVAVGDGWWLAIDWWLVGVGGWRLVAVGGWWRLAVGGWRSLGAVRSLRAVLRKKKKKEWGP